MNTTTLNMTTLDGGNVIIKRGEGGGGTINNQDKVVDITENGTTEVVADGGFTGLGKVTINTEVSGGESGGGDWHYFDVSNAALTDKSALYEFGALVVKLSMEGNTIVGAASMGAVISFDNCVAFGLDMSQKSNMGGEMLTYKEIYATAGLDSFFSQLGIVEITEAEFYNLD